MAHRAPDDHQRCIAVSDAPERGPALARGRLVTAASRQLTCGRAARRPASVATSPPVPGTKLVLGYEAKAKRGGLYQLVARLGSDITLGSTTEVVNLRVTGH